jgi:hypothetical protein
MRTLHDYQKEVEEFESGHCPARFSGQDGALKLLIHEMCSAPWQTREERNKAQVLVIRLDTLRVSSASLTRCAESVGCTEAGVRI